MQRNRGRYVGNRGLAKLEQLALIVAVCFAGFGSISDLGSGLSTAVTGTTYSSVAPFAVEQPSAGARPPVLRSSSQAATGALARLSKLSTVADIARASIGRSARKASEQIPAIKVKAAANLIDDTGVHSRKLRSIEDLAVIDLEFLRVKPELEGQLPDWWVFEIGVATMENGREISRAIEVDAPLSEYKTSFNFRARGERNPVDYEEAIVSLAREVLGREMAFYNNIDGPRLLGAIDESIPKAQGVTRISKERVKALKQIDSFAEKQAAEYQTALANLQELMRAQRRADDGGKAAQISLNRKLGAFKRYSKKNFGRTIDPDDLALAELRRRLRHEEQIDLLVAVRMHEYDGRANNLTAVTQRKLPKKQQLTDRVDGEDLAESTAHQADADALATYRIARTTKIKEDLEADLPDFLRRQRAFRALSDETYRVVGAGIEGDALLSKPLAEVSLLFIEAAGTEARASDSAGRMIGLGIADELDEADVTQAFHISDKRSPIPDVGQELRIRPVRYKVPFDTQSDFVEVNVTRESHAAHRISNRAVHGSEVEGVEPKPTFPVVLQKSLKRPFAQNKAVASWGADVEQALFSAEYYPRIAEKGVQALPEVLRREFVDLEKVFINLLNSRAKAELKRTYNIDVDKGDRLPMGTAYKLLFGRRVTQPEGSLSRNAAMARRIMLELQRRELLPNTFGELLELQRGSASPKTVFDWDGERLTSRTVRSK